MFLAILLASLPLIAAGGAVATVIAIPALRRKLPRARRLPGSSRPDTAARVVVGTTSAALILFTVPIVMPIVYRGLGYRVGDHWWWRYADVLILSCLAMFVVAILLACYRRRPDEPVAPTHPRTWRSFTTATQLWTLSVSVVALLLLVAFAGSASSPDEDGRYRMLEIETGGVSGAITTFFGWAYGLPVAGVVAVLVALTVTALHLNAARPFLKSTTAPDEEVSRSTLSALLVWFTVGAVLVTLGRSMHMVSSAAALSLTTEGYTWATTLAALSPWLYWVALLVQSVAYVVLGLVIAVACLRHEAGALPTRPAPDGAEVVAPKDRGSSTYG